jgi:hypothetical protein
MSDQDPTAPGQQPPAPPEPYDEPTRVDRAVSDPTMAMPAPVPLPDEGPPSDPVGPDGPAAPPPDRRRWLIVVLLVLLLLLGLGLWLLLQDDDDDASGATTTTTSSTTTSSTTTTTAPPTTTTTAPTTTTAAPVSTIDPARCVSSPPDDPSTTANVVYEAYAVNDRGCASNLMTSDALDDLFAIPGAGGGWEFRGCDQVPDPEADPTSCFYRFEGGSTTFSMQYDSGWVVFGVSQTPD